MLRQLGAAGALLLQAVSARDPRVPRVAPERSRREPAHRARGPVLVHLQPEETNRRLLPQAVHRTAEEGQRHLQLVHAPGRARVFQLCRQRMLRGAREAAPKGTPDAGG